MTNRDGGGFYKKIFDRFEIITYIKIVGGLDMPTLLILFGLRFYFYSNEHAPFHVHVESADGEAKFEIVEETVCLRKNDGMKQKDLKLAEAIIEENKENFKALWLKFFEKDS